MEVVAEIRYDRGNQIGIGQGMNSLVYLADDPQLGGQLAVKEIEKNKFGNDIARYFAEAQVMFATAHPNIVPIQYACQTASHIVLAMPYFVKGSLASRICDVPIPINEVIRIAQGVLHGLARIHGEGFIHFDLKPSNVLFDDIDAPMVSDFGQTRRVLANGVVQVPPMYANAVPPEVWASGVGSALSDIYQAGLLLYRAVNGDPLYRSQFANLDDATVRKRVIAGKLPGRKLFLPHVSKRFRTIVRKALSPDPSHRYQSAVELASAIARIPRGLNWRTTRQGAGELSWQAERLGKTDLEVELVVSTNSRWEVRVWTVDGNNRRAKNRLDHWRTDLTHADAMQHLSGLFARLV
jgi:serine/threonine protein kinase